MLLALSLLVLTGPAWDVGISIGRETTDGVAALTSSSRGSTRLVGDRTIAGEWLSLSVGAAVSTKQSALVSHADALLGLKASFVDVFGPLTPYARVLAMASRASVELGRSMRASRILPGAQADLGLRVGSHRHGLSLFAFAEGSYVLTYARSLAIQLADAKAVGEARPVPLGRVDLSGWSARVGVGVTF